MNEKELMDMTKEQLQDLLRAAGLPVSGKLEELRARLRLLGPVADASSTQTAAPSTLAAAPSTLAAAPSTLATAPSTLAAAPSTLAAAPILPAGDELAKAEEAKAQATAMPVIHCPGCKRTTLDRLYANSQVQAVTCYATQRYPTFRVRYCACRACGRRWTERGK